MNIFSRAKIKEGRELFSNCYICKKEFKPDSRNKNRGCGLFCSKAYAAKWREKNKDVSEERDFKLNKLGI